MQRKLMAALALSAAAAYSFSAQAADTWPSKPLTIVVPFAPGGANDLIARLYAKQIGVELKADVIVENRPGAGAVVGTAHVARSQPDGYTFLVASNGTVTNTLIRSDQPFKDDEIEPVAMLAIVPSIIVTNPANPAKDLKELVENAKKNSSRPVTFSTAGMGSTPDFVGAMVKLETGVNMQTIPYKSGAENVAAVVGGQTDMTSEADMVTLPLVKAGKLKALATTWDHLAVAPDIKTTAELGFPNIRIGHWEGLYVRAGTPADIMDKVNAAVLRASKSKEILDVLNAYSVVPGTMTRPEFVKFTQDERVRLGKVVKGANMQPD
ncbi:MAG TPA: tripartite tricarboxylate transporter substrate binding protein [Bordetella sp.]